MSSTLQTYIEEYDWVIDVTQQDEDKIFDIKHFDSEMQSVISPKKDSLTVERKICSYRQGGKSWIFLFQLIISKKERVKFVLGTKELHPKSHQVQGKFKHGVAFNVSRGFVQYEFVIGNFAGF